MAVREQVDHSCRRDVSMILVAIASFLSLLLAVLVLFGLPKQVPASHGCRWVGQGLVASWFVGVTNQGVFIEIWSDPKRTGMPFDAATTIKTY